MSAFFNNILFFIKVLDFISVHLYGNVFLFSVVVPGTIRNYIHSNNVNGIGNKKVKRVVNVNKTFYLEGGRRIILDPIVIFISVINIFIFRFKMSFKVVGIFIYFGGLNILVNV